jgi:putative transposase
VRLSVARYYDPSVGRFLSTDPVEPSAGNAFNFNRYAYASNNPIINMDPDGTRDIVIDALRMAWFKRHPSKQAGLIFHSDRGSQYASEDFRDLLKDYGITASMSRRGNCWDNACSETLFGSLKVERLHGQRFVTRRHAKDETLAWLLWYNQSRLHSTLNYVSPMQFDKHWLAAQAKQASP